MFACRAVYPLPLFESSTTYHIASRVPAIRTLQPSATKTESATKEARNTQSDTCEGNLLERSSLRSFLCNHPHDSTADVARREPNASRKHGMQVSSLSLGTLTLSLALSPPASITAPRRKRILHLC